MPALCSFQHPFSFFSTRVWGSRLQQGLIIICPLVSEYGNSQINFKCVHHSWGRKTLDWRESIRCLVISTVTVSKIIRHTHSHISLSLFLYPSVPPLYSLFSLSSLVYHSLYSLEPIYYCKITGAWLFPCVGFYCRFPASLMWILSSQHVNIDVWEKSNVSLLWAFPTKPSMTQLELEL